MARLKTESKRKEILDAAARVFSTGDFHRILIDHVAADAGVGKGTIYRYFQTKEDLYFATILHGFDGLAAALSNSPGGGPDPAERLERIAREVLDYFWSRADLSKMLMEDERRFASRQEELGKRRQVLQQLVERAIADGVASGFFFVGNVSTAATLFRGMIRATLDARGPADAPDRAVADILEIFLHGISRRPA
jgi:AcrR family transcriptional regulator